MPQHNRAPGDEMVPNNQVFTGSRIDRWTTNNIWNWSRNWEIEGHHRRQNRWGRQQHRRIGAPSGLPAAQFNHDSRDASHSPPPHISCGKVFFDLIINLYYNYY